MLLHAILVLWDAWAVEIHAWRDAQAVWSVALRQWILLITHNMSPLVQFGIFLFPSYSAMTVIGICGALIMAYSRNLKYQLSWKQYVVNILASLLGVFLGSRLLFIITKLPELFNNFSLKNALHVLLNGGFVFYGGLFGALEALKICALITHTDRKMVYNLFVPSFILFHAFGRIGCFLAGCCYGVECPFGFEMLTSPGVIRFPVQLAESVCDILILVAILIIEKKKGIQTDLLRIYMVSYAVCRFLLEFLRGDEIRGHFLCFSTSQWIALGVLAFYSVKFLIDRRKKNTSLLSPKSE